MLNKKDILIAIRFSTIILVAVSLTPNEGKIRIANFAVKSSSTLKKDNHVNPPQKKFTWKDTTTVQ